MESNNSEIKRLYNILVENVETEEDIILRLSDILKIFLILSHKAFQQCDNKVLLINSIKALVNEFVSNLMTRVSEEEINTIE